MQTGPELKSKKQQVNLNHLVKELENIVVQQYIEKPCLINGKKFDIRSYLAVICCKPYFVFAHDGYCRISLLDYTTSNFCAENGTEVDGMPADLASKLTHLTNLSVQKKHPRFKDLKQAAAMHVTPDLCNYLIKTGSVKDESDFKSRVTDRINEVMKLTFLQIKDRLDRKFGSFELFGYDFMLDAECNPQLLEINVNPALFLDTEV